MAFMIMDIRCFIDRTHRFPQYVFEGRWDSFHFFDSDRMLEAHFTQVVKALLHVEGGTCALMIDLDVAGSDEWSRFQFDRDTTEHGYQTFLGGNPATGEGWLYGVDRFACNSNVGEWCIYCESGNEIGVLAIGDKERLPEYQMIIDELHALEIEQAILLPLSYGFSARALSQEWRSELVKQYGRSEKK